jgi:hypothetical protein
MHFALVQVSYPGTRKLRAGEPEAARDRSVEVSLPEEGAWPGEAECVNVRTGNPAVVGTYVP